MSDYIPTGDKTHAKRANQGKVDLSLLPVEACMEECRVWMHGEEKYGRDNWRKLWGNKTIAISLASALRHIFAMLKGELYDPDSGFSHAAHVRCNMAMILLYLEQLRKSEFETEKEETT